MVMPYAPKGAKRVKEEDAQCLDLLWYLCKLAHTVHESIMHSMKKTWKRVNRRMNRPYLGIFLNFPLMEFFWAFFFLTQDILRIQNQLSLLLLHFFSVDPVLA